MVRMAWAVLPFFLNINLFRIVNQCLRDKLNQLFHNEISFSQGDNEYGL